jgi:hypothetical protein
LRHKKLPDTRLTFHLTGQDHQQWPRASRKPHPL